MNDLYLILHIAHGKPTFDIARRVEIEEEEAFLLTGGYRAFPYKSEPLNAFSGGHGRNWFDYWLDEPPPADHPWCFVGMSYPGSKHKPPELTLSHSNLLERLGLVKKIVRRV